MLKLSKLKEFKILSFGTSSNTMYVLLKQSGKMKNLIYCIFFMELARPNLKKYIRVKKDLTLSIQNQDCGEKQTILPSKVHIPTQITLIEQKMGINKCSWHW